MTKMRQNYTILFPIVGLSDLVNKTHLCHYNYSQMYRSPGILVSIA